MPSPWGRAAIALGQGSLFNSFMITGGTGAVEVTFSLALEGELHGFADALGSFETEIIAALELDGSPLLFRREVLAGGPTSPTPPCSCPESRQRP